MKNLIGSTIKHYHILLKIRETGTRILYRAFDTKQQKHVGLEVVKTGNIKQSELLALLSEQAAKIAQLDHPNIAPVIDSGIADGTIFFIFDFSPSNTLRRLFHQSFSWQKSAQDLVTVAQIVAHAHQQGLVHGFLSPTSIILDENNNACLFDFGFEQIIINYTLGHIPGSWINTWGYAYCAPEQIAGEKIDTRSDVYSMGMILHEWMTGEIALLDETVLGTLFRRKSTQSKSLDLKKISPPEIQVLIQKSVALNPQSRYQTMQELGILLARGAIGLDLTKKTAQNPLTISEPRVTNPYQYPMILLVTLFVAAIIIWTQVRLPQTFTNQPAFSQADAYTQTPVKTKTPASQSLPATATKSAPTATPQNTGSSQEKITAVSFPILEGTALPSSKNVITAANVNRVITLSQWGIGEINHFSNSPVGNDIAVASSIGVFIYRSEDLRLEKHLDTRSWVSIVEFSPDGKMLASGDRDGLIVLWNTTTGQEIQSYSGHQAGIIGLAFSPDGNRLVSISQDNTLMQWDITADSQSLPALLHVNRVKSVAYASDGKFIVTGGDDFKINIWDAQNFSAVKAFTISSKVIQLKNIKNSSYIVSGGSDRRVTLIDLEEKETFAPLSGVQYELSDVSVSPDGNLITAGDIHGGIVTWDRSGKMIWQAPKTEWVEPSKSVLGKSHILMYSLNGKQIFSGLRNGAFRVFDALTGEKIQEYPSLNSHTIRFAISHDSTLGIFQMNDGILKIWDLTNGKVRFQKPGAVIPGHVFSKNDRIFAVAFGQNSVKVFNTLSGAEIHTFNGHQNIQAIEFVHNDTHLAVGNAQTMRLWSISSGQELKAEKNYNINGCTTLYDLNKSAILHVTKFHRIVENAQYNPILCSFKQADWMKAFIVSEATGQIVSGGNSKLEVINLKNLSQGKIEMKGVNRLKIEIVAIHPDGNLLASAMDDYTIRIWDVNTQEELMRLYGHENSISDLHFTPNGRLLISSSLDGTIRLWGVP
jgi:WD40 repeat protein